MLTLRNTFKYQGDIKQSAFPRITLAALFPIFDYVRDPAADVSVSRKIVSSDRAEVDQDLSRDSYRISAPTADLVGTNVETLGNFLAYTTTAIAATSVNDLSFTIPVQFAAASASVGGSALQAIYLIKNFRKLFDQANRVEMMMRAQAGPDPAAAVAFLDKNIFLVNKQAYDNSLPEFKKLTGRNDDWLLLSVIQRFVEEADVDPGSPFEFTNASFAIVARIVQENKIESRDAIVRFVGMHFKDWLDFPILVPAIKSVVVAGVFQVNTPDGSAIGKDDLLFYELSLEYAEWGPANTATPRIVHYDWKTKNAPVNQNKTPFSFAGTGQIIPTNVVGMVTVSVKAFDGTLLWVREYDPNDPGLKEVMIVVSQVRPATLTAGATITTGDSKRLRGQVLELTKKCPLKGITVVIQAKQDGDELWRVVAAANTDGSGSFSMPYPYGVYTKAQAIVSLTPENPADIPIRDVGPNATIADDFLYLLITDPACPESDKTEDCACDTLKTPARLPDHADLISSSEYMQDIGGSCVNLSTPNRTLSEFCFSGIVRTSDPHIANYRLTRITLPASAGAPVDDDIYKFELKSDQKKIRRAAVDIDNQILWQDAPGSGDNLTFYQAVTVATGHVLHYKSVLKADGYSLGDLLYSLALAPGQKKEMVVIDSAHSLQAAESQNIAQGESLAASLLSERGITDQLLGNIGEALRGSSSASTGGISAGLGVGANIGIVSGALGVAGGYSNSSASAAQNSSRDTSMFFGEKLRQSIMQSAESYRQLNATVVTAVKEGQQYAVTTDVVANHNHCHALTMMYFEVLRHYAVFQEMVSVEECIFVPLLMTNFTKENIYKWSDVLARNLLPLSSNTYLGAFNWGRQHPLLKAFDANERKLTNYAHVDFPIGRYCDENITSVLGTLTIRANIPRPKTRFDRILSLPIIRKTVTTQGGVDVQGTIRDNIKSSVVGALTGGLSLLFGGGPSVKMAQESHEVLTNEKIFDSFMTLDENYESVPPAQCIRVHNFQKVDVLNGAPIDFFGSYPDDKKLWESYASILEMDLFELLNKFSGNVISDWDKIFFDEIAPQVLDKLISDDTLSLKPFGGLDLTRTNRYTGGTQLITYNVRTAVSQTRATIGHLDLKHTLGTGVLQPIRLALDTTFNIENLSINYSTNHYRGQIYSGYVGDDLLDGKTTVINTPLNWDEKREPRKEDTYLVAKLIAHLNSNLEHYNKALWYNLDPDRRYMLLDGFNIQVYNDLNVPIAGSRSLASVVKNELLTVTGNSLVFPIAAGYRVSQSYISERNKDGETEDVSLFEHYRPFTPVPPYRISVPSKGVFVEAVQGACDACERVKENSSQDWTKFPTDEPTPIMPVITPVPTITDWKAAFKDFAPPLINIQNAPALPAPAAGLAGVTELLGKAGIFKDITGLDATQQNVIRTYLSNQENAKAFAEMAKEMAMQEHNTQHSDKIMESLKGAKDGGAISQAEYGKLVKDHIQKQIDGGDAEKGVNTANNSDLGKAAADSVKNGRQVAATQTHPDGTQTTVDQKPTSVKLSDGSMYLLAGTDRETEYLGTPSEGDVVIGDASEGLGKSIRDFLKGSLQRKANPDAKWEHRKKPSVTRGGGVRTVDESPWDFGMDFEPQVDGPKVTSVTIFHPEHGHDMTVLDSLRWHDVHVAVPNVKGGQPIHLPLTEGWVLGYSHVGKGSVPTSPTDPLWRLATTLSASVVTVLGYQLEDDGRLVPLPRELIDADDFGSMFSAGVAQGAGGSKRRWILVCLELSTCAPSNDYQPDPVAEVARIYPLTEIVCNFDADFVDGSTTMVRPATSSMLAGMADGGKMVLSAYADRNLSTLPPDWTTKPWWSTLFDYYGTPGSFAAVTSMAGYRQNATKRKVLAAGAIATYQPTEVKKWPRQGTFDNLHIAPQMEFTRAGSGVKMPVLMAPICIHDCFHVHWRWGASFTATQMMGWNASGPYSVVAAPMVPLNQTVQITPTANAPGFTYRAVATKPERMRWTVFMHHGAGYAIRLANNQLGIALDGVVAGIDQTWAGFYHWLRYENIANKYYERVDADISVLGPL